MQFNQILQPRFSSLLTRYFAIRGAGSPAPTLAPEIAPVFNVNQQDDTAAFYTRNERLAHYGAGTLAAQALNYTRALLRNPAGSGILLIVERVLLNTGVTGYGILTATTVDDANAQVGYLRDYRWVQSAGVVSPSAILSWGNASPVAPNGGNGRVYTSAANQSQWQECNVIIPPGGAFYLYAGTVNTAINTVGFDWRERALPNEEVGNG